MARLLPLVCLIGYMWLADAIAPMIGIGQVWLLVPAIIGLCFYWARRPV